jgi:hypothetical protein
MSGEGDLVMSVQAAHGSKSKHRCCGDEVWKGQYPPTDNKTVRLPALRRSGAELPKGGPEGGSAQRE